jgi:DNA-binding beta-propeller fold protein YncE
MLKFVPWILVSTLFLLFPGPSSGADIDVVFEDITALDGRGLERVEFLAGEEIQVRIRMRVLRAGDNLFRLRLRVTGDGWHEIRTSQALFGPGTRVITFDGPAVGEAGPGKVSLLADIVSEQDSVSLLGRRHGFLTIRCPEGAPAGITDRFEVGPSPADMALTADGQYLYVTSLEDRKLTVIDVEAREIAAEIEDHDQIGFPEGVAASPNGQEMFIADSAHQAINVIDANTHVWLEMIRLNPTGDFGVTSPGDLVVNPVRNEVYVTDSRGPRIFILDLDSLEVRMQALVGNPPSGMMPLQLMLDPDSPRFLYVLCGGLNEVIKLNVANGVIVDFVQLRDFTIPSTLWPIWSMTVNPVTDEIYVVGNPGGFESTYPTIESKIYALPKNNLSGPGRRELLLGSSVWDLVVWENGRYVYGIDSYLGEILIIDMNTGTDLVRCSIPAERGGRHLRADLNRGRLYIGGWLAGFASIVE